MGTTLSKAIFPPKITQVQRSHNSGFRIGQYHLEGPEACARVYPALGCGSLPRKEALYRTIEELLIC
jgi:hypothetical protein